MATSKFQARIIQVGTSGSDSIAVAVSPDAKLNIRKDSEEARGVMEISRVDGGERFSVGLSGMTAGNFTTAKKTAERIMRQKVGAGVEYLSGFFYIAKATSESAKGGACGSQWERDGEKFALVAMYEDNESSTYIAGERGVLEIRSNHDDKLLAVISAFGISSTRLDSWLGDSCPIGKHGKLSKSDRLKLDIARQQKTVEAQRANLEASEQVLADLLAMLPKKEREALSA